MDKKRIIEMTEEEQAWCEQNKAWIEADSIRAKSLKEALNGKKISVLALRGFIEKKKEADALLATQGGGGGAKKRECEQNQKQLFLPGVGETMAAQPNALARTSLFAPVRAGRRKVYNCDRLISRKDIVIEFSGVQLTEDHADICMELISIQTGSGIDVGDFVPLVCATVLKNLGWGTGGKSYNRFHRCMKELSAATIFIETFRTDGTSKYKLGVSSEQQSKTRPSIGQTDLFRLVDKFKNEEGGEDYQFKLDPGWFKLFSNNEYALIDLDARRKIKSRFTLAKSLQRLIATSKNSVQRYQLIYLKELAQDFGRIRDFRDRVTGALNELRRIGIIDEWNLGKNSKKCEQVTIWVKGFDEQTPIDCDFEEV